MKEEKDDNKRLNLILLAILIVNILEFITVLLKR